MAVYAVGDIQGCYQTLRLLLDQVRFDVRKDTLWCCGDMVNRGPDSLAVLRYLKDLGDACVCVLGNHDLQLLAYAAGGKSFAGDTLDDVLVAADADELIDWLRFRPLLHHDHIKHWTMVHAGLHPEWSLKQAKKRAAEISRVLQSADWKDFCISLQQKSFPIRDSKLDRLQFATAVLTRVRYCQQDGLFNWANKTSDSSEGDLKPWFGHTKLRWAKKTRVVYGHWAAKGVVADEEHVLGLDSGCVWGGKLTLAKLGKKKIKLYSQASEIC